MRVFKKMLVLLLAFAMMLSNTAFTVLVNAEDSTVDAINVVLVDLINKRFAQFPTNANASNLFSQTYSKNGVDYNFDKVAALEFELENLEDAFSVKLSFSNYWEKTSNNFVEVYAVQGCTFDANDYESTADSINSAQQTLVGTLAASSSHNNTNRTRVVDLDPVELSNLIDQSGKIQLIVRIKNTTGRTAELKNENFSNPKITITPDVPPTISGETISGVAVEGFDLSVDYLFSSDLHEEKDSVIDWLCADNESGDNERVILSDGGKNLHIESDYVGKYIRAKITPYSDDGIYVKGGREHANIYYTNYIGPIKSVAYLDELAASISQECSDTTELYNYLDSYEAILGIDVAQLDTYSKKDQVLTNVLLYPPTSFADLTYKFTNEFTTIKIEEATASEIEGLLSDTQIDLTQYEELVDKDFVLASLETEVFEKYQDLVDAFSKFVSGSLIKTESSAENLAVMLDDNAQLFTADVDGCTYGELLYAGRYIVAADKTSVTNFEGLNNLVTEAIAHGKENYTGGYITSKKIFVDEVCIKTDYTSNANGVNSIVSPASTYRLFGNANVENYTQQLFLKLDISDLMDYHIQSASINLYGTVGGGADKIFEIVTTNEFESADDFLLNHPTGTDIVRGEVLGQVKYSFGTTKWSKADITDTIIESAENGEDYVYLMIDYIGNAVSCDLSKGGTIHSLAAGEEFAPYVEIIYETPPIVKNININGVKAVGSTLTAEYDYFGCYEEKGSVYQWYYADKTAESYENKTLISQENRSSLELKEEHAGKCIMVEIKPRSEEGAYREGEFTPSGYTLSILNSQEASELTNELNLAADISTVISSEEKADYLDVNLVADMEGLETEGKTKVFSVLTNTTFTDLNHFKSYYNRMINVQKINEASYEELDNLIKTLDTGTTIDRYSDLESNSSVLTAVYNKGFENVEAYQNAFNEACAVYEFDSVDHSNVQELLLAYDFMFSQDVSSYDEDKLELVGNYFMTEIQNKKGSFSTIQTALTNAVNSANNYTPSIDPPSGGGGNTGGGGKDKEVQVPPSSETVIAPTPVVPAKVFKDQDAIADWAKESVLTLSASGIISGDGNGNFRPDDSITREEFLKIVVTAFDINGDGEANFEDVDKDAWYSEYINKAVSAGIINGIGDNKFGTGMYISREDMSVILYRALLSKDLINQHSSARNAFDDNEVIADYADKAVATLVKYGVINGVGDNKFAPKANSTRAMVAVMACRALEIKK